MSEWRAHLRMGRRKLLILGIILGITIAMGVNLGAQAAAPPSRPKSTRNKPALLSKKSEKPPQSQQKTKVAPPKVLGQSGPTLSSSKQTLIWQQDFTKMSAGKPDPAFWNIATPSLPIYNNERQIYKDQPENVRIENGTLVLEARAQGSSYSSGRVDTLNLKNIEINSRLEARLKLPKGKGVWPAFWLLSANQPHTSKLNPTDADWQQPRFYMWDGEIDIMEAYGTYPGMVEATTHTFSASKEGMTRVPDASEAFHTYWFEWKADRLDFGVDGTTYFTQQKTSSSPADWPYSSDNKYYLILNLAMGGSGGGQIVSAPGDSWRLEIASVKYYKLTN